MVLFGGEGVWMAQEPTTPLSPPFTAQPPLPRSVALICRSGDSLVEIATLSRKLSVPFLEDYGRENASVGCQSHDAPLRVLSPFFTPVTHALIAPPDCKLSWPSMRSQPILFTPVQTMINGVAKRSRASLTPWPNGVALAECNDLHWGYSIAPYRNSLGTQRGE